jgi:5-methylcytosine-specific restriction enzyme subunit McrC
VAFRNRRLIVINLFEYQNKETIDGSFTDLEIFLEEIWNRREKNSFYSDIESSKQEVQPFLQFLRKTNQIKSNKYIGVIHFEGEKINLLPKIFYEDNRKYSENDSNVMQSHILWWLSYCRKVKFPNYQTSLGGKKSDFFEILIYLFSKYTRELFSNSVYQQYEEINQELSFIKGRLNTNEYIHENIARGNWHKLNCTYDAFIFDNLFNRIIKYVAKLLLNVTEISENKKYLREILFILEEVRDVTVTREDCLQVKFNPMFEEFETVRDYCYLFINHSISFNYKNNLKLFAFLLPMESIFEDFVFGFIDKELKGITAKSQISSVYLDEEKIFTLKPDIHLQIGSREILADTKYKILYSEETDPKKGISQSDLYQMISYAIRFKIQEIILFYPNTFSNNSEPMSCITIQDRLANEAKIFIKVFQLPIINSELFMGAQDENLPLLDLFYQTQIELKNRLEEILFS